MPRRSAKRCSGPPCGSCRSRAPTNKPFSCAVLADQLRDVAARVPVVEGELMAWHRANEVSRRLATIRGVGPITASAIVATVGEATQFKSGRQFAAWLGLVPQQRSSGGKEP